jgi:2-polyprenyl-6-methoxyphenol hydroxylase-like FAD-dependent oxidoreductase
VTQCVLVIGAGIAGLTTAVALQRRGHQVAILEERTDGSSGSGVSIWPNALAALDEIGLGDAVVGAHGVGSMVARHLNGSLGRRYAGYTAWRGIATYALDVNLAGETVGNGTEFGHVPLGPDHT